jgi:hypothetical protein
MKVSKIDINPKLIFPEDIDEEDKISEEDP